MYNGIDLTSNLPLLRGVLTKFTKPLGPFEQ